MKKKSNFKKIVIGELNKILITKKNKLKRISNEKNFLEGYFYEVNNLMWDEMRRAVKDIKIIKKGKKISNDIDTLSEESEINSYHNRNFQVFWEEASAAYTEINMPLGTFIKEKEIIIAIVTELGYKAMIKLDILNFTIHNFVEILNKFKDKGKIEIKAFCAKKIEIPYNIKNMKNIKKIDIEDGIVVISEEDRNCIINVDKFLVKILEKYEIFAEIIEYSDEDIHNLLMFF